MTDTVFDAATGVFARQISTSDLGDQSYVVVVGDQAAVIDPQRDVERFDDALLETGARLVAVFETDMHNDYVTGGRILADRHGATCYVPAGSEATFEHEELSDGDRVTIGEWQLVAMLTPGHTLAHTSYCLLSPAGEAVAVFSGGSMLVGAVGRSDLLGPDLAEGLTRQQYHSEQRLAGELPGAASCRARRAAGRGELPGAASCRARRACNRPMGRGRSARSHQPETGRQRRSSANACRIRCSRPRTRRALSVRSLPG